MDEVRAHLDACHSCREIVAGVARGMAAPPGSDDTEPVALAPWEGEPLEGRLIAGKYRVERVLGAGGMGYVLAALHVQLGTRVALKVLRPDVVLQEEARARFMREARAAARLTSPYAVRVFDVSTLDDGVPFLVMELLEGRDLADERRARGALPVAEAVRYVLQAAHALAEAHAAGIVHRDLKPANMFIVDGAKTIKLLDFGVSKMLGHSLTGEEFRTSEASWLGTPRYMAPEQLILAQPVDRRTDIWGLGVVLYELLAGTLPFPGDSIEAHCRAVLQSPPIALDTARPGTPSPLARVVHRCLEKDPAARYASVAELARDLAPFVDREDQGLLDAIFAGGSGPRAARPARRPSRRLLALVAAAGVALAAVLVGVGYVARRASAPAPAASTAPTPDPPAADAPAVDPLGDSRQADPAAAQSTTAPPRSNKDTRPWPQRAPHPRRNAEFGSRR